MIERNLSYIALFAALIAVLGLIPKIDLISGIPITAQSLGIMLCGAVLGARRGALAVLMFLLLVALGLPILAGGRGGLGVFAGPSVGFLIGFPVAAFVIGKVIESTNIPIFWATLLGAFWGGVVVLYAFGIAGMAWMLNMSLYEALISALAFLPGDLIKVTLTAFITRSISRARPNALLSRHNI